MPSNPSEPRLSATVLLLRDDESLQVLMVERHYEIDFAAGALVFPGGKASDDDTRDGWDARSDGSFTGVEQIARIASVREAFEETGILLARAESNRGEGAPLVGPDIAEKLAPMRSAVDRGEASFLDLLAEYGLVAALDTLVHFAHWITPDMMPKRFDTHFYLAPTPPDQLAAHDGRETTDSVWIDPQDALDRADAGKATIIFPTRMNLAKLAEEPTVEAAVKRFRTETVVSVLPVVGTDDDGNPCLHIPAEAGYIQTMEPLERVKNVAKPK